MTTIIFVEAKPKDNSKKFNIFKPMAIEKFIFYFFFTFIFCILPAIIIRPTKQLKLNHVFQYYLKHFCKRFVIVSSLSKHLKW